jgi:hypothetical protein
MRTPFGTAQIVGAIYLLKLWVPFYYSNCGNFRTRTLLLKKNIGQSAGKISKVTNTRGKHTSNLNPLFQRAI